MYSLFFRKLKISLIPLVFITFIIGSGCSTQTIPKAGIFEANDNTQIVKGVAARVEEDSLIVQYSRDDTIRLETSEDMVLKGFPSIWAIETDQPLKINYRTTGKRNIIISITKVPRLGC
ncbi:MAG: hypothetical protein ACLFV2_08855 [Desulfurivibrionaceae bacterium]